MTTQNELPLEFKLTDAQEAEVDALVGALFAKCKELELPVRIAICVARDSNGFRLTQSTYFNGERTPNSMCLADMVLENNITHPMQLISSMTDDSE